MKTYRVSLEPQFPHLPGGTNNTGCSIGNCFPGCMGEHMCGPQQILSFAPTSHQENGHCHGSRMCFALPDLKGLTTDKRV